MMPPPVHLADCAVPDDPWLDEEPFRGALKCPCGGTRFTLLYVGQRVAAPDGIHVGYIKDSGGWFYVIRARCAKCGTCHTLYDKDYHGWNGFVAFDRAERKRPRPPDAEFRCPRCDCDVHRVRLEILAEGRADFIDQAMGDGDDERSRFEEDDWPNAFGWIHFDLTCVACGLETKQWAGDESM